MNYIGRTLSFLAGCVLVISGGLGIVSVISQLDRFNTLHDRFILWFVFAFSGALLVIVLFRKQSTFNMPSVVFACVAIVWWWTAEPRFQYQPFAYVLLLITTVSAAVFSLKAFRNRAGESGALSWKSVGKTVLSVSVIVIGCMFLLGYYLIHYSAYGRYVSQPVIYSLDKVPRNADAYGGNFVTGAAIISNPKKINVGGSNQAQVLMGQSNRSLTKDEFESVADAFIEYPYITFSTMNSGISIYKRDIVEGQETITITDSGLLTSVDDTSGNAYPSQEVVLQFVLDKETNQILFSYDVRLSRF